MGSEMCIRDSGVGFVGASATQVADAEDQSAFSRFVDDLSPAALVRHLRRRGTDEPDAEEPSTDER